MELLVSIDSQNNIPSDLLGNKVLTSVSELEDKGGELYNAGDNSYYDYKIDVNKLASIVFTHGSLQGCQESEAERCRVSEEYIPKDHQIQY